MKIFTNFKIEWYNTLTGTVLSTETKYHGALAFKIQVPNSINIFQHKDLAFRIYPNGENFKSQFQLNEESIELSERKAEIKDSLELDDFKLNLFPNPVKDVLSIQSNKIFTDINIIDLIGKNVFMISNINTQNYQLDLKNLKPGVYLVKVKSNNEWHIEKLIHE